MVVEEGKEEDLSLSVRVGRIGEIGTVHGVPLPEPAKVGALEAAVGLWALLGEELCGSSAPLGEVAAEGAWGNVCLRGWMGLVERKDLYDRACGAKGLLALERFCAVEGFRGKRPGMTVVRARLWFEALKAFLLVDTFPAGECGCADGVSGRVRDVVVLCGDPATHLLLAAGWVLAAQQGQDEGVTKEGDRGVFVGVGHGCLLRKDGPSIRQEWRPVQCETLLVGV
jgi:hypothetical protein